MTNNKRRPALTLGEKLLFAAGILFCLVLISTSMMGGLFARYVTTGTGQDSARVAKFGDLTLTETGDFVGDNVKTGIIIPGVNMNKKVTLSFEASEVATIVFVEVSAPDWTLTGAGNNTFVKGDKMLSWGIADGWTYLPGSKYVYYLELAPNTALTDVYIIKDGIIHVGENIYESNIGDLDNLSLSFQVSVIQNDGSLTPATAWDKLN